MTYGPNIRRGWHRGYGLRAPVPWDVTGMTYTGDSFGVAAQDATPTGIYFKPDGLKMYVIGQANDRVYEYDLTTAWDITTAAFLQFFSVAAQDTNPSGLFFRADGLKMYITGQTGDEVDEYNLGVAWDISTAVFVQVFSVALQDPNPTGVYFSPDGLLMFVAGATNVLVFRYTLGVAWDISTAVFDQQFHVLFAPRDLSFKSDGTILYCCTTGAIRQFEMTTPWDLSTASSFGTAPLVRIFAPVSQVQGLFIRADGLRAYVTSNDTDSVEEFTFI